MSETAIIDMIEAGKKAFSEKAFEKAAAYFNKVLRHGERYADVLNLQGVIFHHQGLFNNAIELFQEAITVNPHYLEPRLNLAILYNDLGDYPKARKLYRKLGKKSGPHKPSSDPILNGKLANQHAAMGSVYWRLGRFKEAAAEYQKALQLGPSYSDIRTRLGSVLYEMGETQAALRELRRACRDNPYFAEARIQLGVTLYACGRTKAAVKEWQAALKRDKKNLKAQTYLAMAQAK